MYRKTKMHDPAHSLITERDFLCCLYFTISLFYWSNSCNTGWASVATLVSTASVLFLLKEKVPKSSSTDEDTTHPCTCLD